MLFRSPALLSEILLPHEARLKQSPMFSQDVSIVTHVFTNQFQDLHVYIIAQIDLHVLEPTLHFHTKLSALFGF